MKKNYKFPIIDGIKKCSKCFIDKPVIEYLKGMHHCKKCHMEPIIKRRKEVYNEYDKISDEKQKKDVLDKLKR